MSRLKRLFINRSAPAIIIFKTVDAKFKGTGIEGYFPKGKGLNTYQFCLSAHFRATRQQYCERPLSIVD